MIIYKEKEAMKYSCNNCTDNIYKHIFVIEVGHFIIRLCPTCKKKLQRLLNK
jgi:Zn finger protein HypA/HybF involved in hydrogenase expression